MRKVIGGKIYDTKTGRKVGEWDNGIYGRDFKQCAETLYRTRGGAFFLYGEGGPMSKYAESHGNSTSGGDAIIVMTEAEAREWAETHLDGIDYESIFGEVEEASDLTTKERVSMSLDLGVMAKLRAHSKKTGVPMSVTVERLLAEMLKAHELEG